MKRVNNPPRASWNELIQRPQLDLEFLDGAVKKIIEEVKANGDRAVRALTLQFDKIQIDNLLVSEKEISEARNQLSNELVNAIEVASGNIEKFHAAQRRDRQVI